MKTKQRTGCTPDAVKGCLLIIVFTIAAVIATIWIMK